MIYTNIQLQNILLHIQMKPNFYEFVTERYIPLNLKLDWVGGYTY